LVERHPNSADEREKLMMCSINLSGQSLGDDKFLPFVIDQFHRSGLDASKICFEITETAAVASFSQANRFIQALKELGCKFALDDFGTGLSSFGYGAASAGVEVGCCLRGEYQPH
jgi:EAL domain-containing protein (putative c-di-GMP-specific phosphodiesterase class I)